MPTQKDIFTFDKREKNISHSLDNNRLHAKVLMNNIEKKSLGDNKVIYYQYFILVTAIILFIIFLAISIVNKSPNFFIATIIITLFFIIFLFLYSKIFGIEYDKSKFYLHNIFGKEEKNVSDFIYIRNINAIPFLYAVYFQDKKYYFIVNSQEYYKNLFKAKRKYAMELTEYIKEFLFDNNNSTSPESELQKDNFTYKK